VIASDGPGEYPVITESRAGNDGLGVTLTPGTVAYVTTGGKFMITESGDGFYLYFCSNFNYFVFRTDT
jgi:hypothetical protein